MYNKSKYYLYSISTLYIKVKPFYIVLIYMQKSMFKQMVESKLNASLNRMQEETIQNPEKTIQELKDIIKAREEDIKVLLIQKDDKKSNYIQNLKDKLGIRYKDYTTFKQLYENGKIPAESYIEALDITLEKVFEVLIDNGVNFS